jgi:hypothetical protein
MTMIMMMMMKKRFYLWFGPPKWLVRQSSGICFANYMQTTLKNSKLKMSEYMPENNFIIDARKNILWMHSCFDFHISQLQLHRFFLGLEHVVLLRPSTWVIIGNENIVGFTMFLENCNFTHLRTPQKIHHHVIICKYHSVWWPPFVETPQKCWNATLCWLSNTWSCN